MTMARNASGGQNVTMRFQMQPEDVASFSAESSGRSGFEGFRGV